MGWGSCVCVQVTKWERSGASMSDSQLGFESPHGWGDNDMGMREIGTRSSIVECAEVGRKRLKDRAKV